MTQTFHSRLGCSTISFRRQPVAGALDTISGLGFDEIDLGALPGVCDHVPYVLDECAITVVAQTVTAAGLRVRSINGDIGDLNEPLTDRGRVDRDRHLERLCALAVAVGAQALVLPCGALRHEPLDTLSNDLALVADELARAADVAAASGIELWTESLHFHRLCCYIDRAQALGELLRPDVGIVMDFSHIVASGADPADFVDRFGPRIAHVHIRDAVIGDINLSVGNGAVDFTRGLEVLADAGYRGHFSLELETRDVTDGDRPAATTAAAHYISELIQ